MPNPPFGTVQDWPISPVGDHTRNATLSTAVTITRPQNARALFLTVETQDVRVRFDGGVATTAIGLIYSAGSTYIIPVSEKLVSISVFEDTASAVINYQWSA